MKVLGTADSPVDFERLSEVCGDDAEMIEEIIELYFSQTSEHLCELEKAIFAKNSEEIYKLAHKIVGGSMTCGMNAIVPAMRVLEQIGRGNQDGADAAQAFEQAQTEFERIKEYLESNKKDLTS